MDASRNTEGSSSSDDVQEVDILLGQRGGSTHWKGNILLRQFAELHAEAYSSANKKGKDEILGTIQNNVKCYGGRFLQELIVQTEDGGGQRVSWMEVDPATARKKIKAQVSDAVKRMNGTYKCSKSLPCHRKPLASTIAAIAPKKANLKPTGKPPKQKQYRKKLPRTLPEPVVASKLQKKKPSTKPAPKHELVGDMNPPNMSDIAWITEISHDDVIIGKDGVSLLWGGNLRLRRIVTEAVSTNFIRGRSFPFNSVMFAITAELQKKRTRFLREFAETSSNGEVDVRWRKLSEEEMNNKLKNACEICILHLAGHGAQIDKSLDELGLFNSVPATEPAKTPDATQEAQIEPRPTPPVASATSVSPASSPDDSETSELARALFGQLRKGQGPPKRQHSVVYELVDSSDEGASPTSASRQATTSESPARKRKRLLEYDDLDDDLDDEDSLTGPMPTARQEEIYQKALRELKEKERKRKQEKMAAKPAAAAKVEKIMKKSSPASPARKLPSTANHTARSPTQAARSSPQRQRPSLRHGHEAAHQPHGTEGFRLPSVGASSYPMNGLVTQPNISDVARRLSVGATANQANALVLQPNQASALRTPPLGTTAIPTNYLVHQPSLADAYRRLCAAPHTVSVPQSLLYSAYPSHPQFVQHTGSNVYIYNAAMNTGLGVGGLGMSNGLGANGGFGVNAGLNTNGGTIMPTANDGPPMEVRSNNR